jgi:hypothetical protein
MDEACPKVRSPHQRRNGSGLAHQPAQVDHLTSRDGGAKAHNPVGITGLTQNAPSKDTLRAPTASRARHRTIRPFLPCHRRADRFLTSPGRWALKWTEPGTRKRPLTENKFVNRIEHRNGIGFRGSPGGGTNASAIADQSSLAPLRSGAFLH